MTPSEKARVQECVRELSEILYRNTAPDKCQTLEEIEKAVREHLLESVGPEMAFFLVRVPWLRFPQRGRTAFLSNKSSRGDKAVENKMNS